MNNFLDYLKGLNDEDMDTGIDDQPSKPMDEDSLTQLFSSLSANPPQDMATSLPSRSGEPAMGLPAPAGMADSLLSRSGDELQQSPQLPPTMPATVQPVPDMFRKEINVSEATKQARPELDKLFTDNEMVNAQNERDRQFNLINLVQAAQQAGTAIAGAGTLKQDPNYLKDLAERTNLPVKNLNERRKGKADLIELASKEAEFSKEKDKDDPKSVVSKLYRETLRGFSSGIKIPDNTSASELEKIYPSIVKLIDTRNAADMKRMTKDALNEQKDLKQRERLDEKTFSQETKLRSEVNNADKDINFSTTKFNYEGLKKKLDTGEFNGVDDIKTIYGFIKALDPGSVVRESETELVFKAESPLTRMLNIPAKITRGDIASPAFRQKLMKSYGDLYNDRKSQFEYKIKPKVNAAKKYGLDINNILTEEIPGMAAENTSGAPSDAAKAPTGTILIKRKSDGVVKAVPLEGSDKYLKNPNFEKVK